MAIIKLMDDNDGNELHHARGDGKMNEDRIKPHNIEVLEASLSDFGKEGIQVR